MLRGVNGSGGGAPVGGSGTTNTIPRWTGASTLGDSVITQNSLFIGVGTTSPGAKLHSFAADGTYQFAVSGTTRAVRFLTNATAAYIEGVDPTLSASFQPLVINGSTVTLANSGTPVLTVNASSNVGIGTASPIKKGTIKGGDLGIDYGQALCFTNGGTAVYTADAAVRVTFSSPNDVLQLQASGASDGIITFHAGAVAALRAERARIDSAGRVGIGTTSPSYNLQVEGTAPVSAVVHTGGAGAYVQATATNGVVGTFTAHNVQLVRAGLTRAMITNTELDISTTAGYGLKLPATPGNADTQTLDCYAEGTWTPTLTGFGGTNPTLTARYTRIGRIVVVQVVIVATGGNQFSSTAATTYISLPAGMTPVFDSPGSTSSSAIAADGACVAYSNGNLYLPTFALRTATTMLNVTYTV